MRFSAVRPFAAFFLLAATSGIYAQNGPVPSAQGASFEVATIKSSPPGDGEDGIQSDGRRLMIRRTPLTYLIAFAYNFPEKRIVGGSDWIKTAKYDIDAVTSVDSVNTSQIPSMVLSLLTERFHLKFHYEQRELSIYSLSVAKGGNKLSKSSTDAIGSNFNGMGMGHVSVRNGDMLGFARWLSSGVMDRPVIDNTSLSGKFDFKLSWAPDDSQYNGMGVRARHSNDGSESLPSIFTAIQEQLGLKLEPAKTKTDVIVIDQIDHPTEN